MDLSGRINETIKFEARIFDKTTDDGHVLFTNEFVRHQHAAHSVRVGNLGLLGRRERDSPGAGFQLHFKELRRHCGFAVWCQPDSVGFNESLHPIEIVRDAILIENR